MGRQNIEAIYPLSPMQQGMLFHSLVTPETGVYMEQDHLHAARAFGCARL